MIETWQKIIMYTVKNRKSKYAIYPFGVTGLQVKRFLNEVLGIIEDIRIDREYSQFTDYVISIESLEKIENYNEYIYLIPSMKYSFAKELLNRGISEKNIVFCCPDAVFAGENAAYEDALIYLIDKIKPASIYDENTFFGHSICKSLYSTINNMASPLFDIKLYADSDKLSHLFPAQKEIYCKEQCKNIDMFLGINEFNESVRNLIFALKCRKNVIISRSLIKELEECAVEKFMYSYLFIYIVEGEKIYGI